MVKPDIVTFGMFCEDYHRWRKMSGERQWSSEVVDRVFQDMARTYLRLSCCISEKELKISKNMMIAAMHEHGIRQEFRERVHFK